MIKVAHYLNQFFVGIGGEEMADIPFSVVEGPMGVGKALEKEFGDMAYIVETFYAGDNYANEHNDLFLGAALAQLRLTKPDVLVAGPAFNAGRYGLACATLLKAAKEVLDIPGVTALATENPAVDAYRRHIYIVPSAASARGMTQIVPPLARLALRLGGKVELGPAWQEGYLARGVRKNMWVDKGAATRAVDLTLARIKGQPFQTELEIISFDRVVPPPPITDLSNTTVALVTEGGVVPAGNPDRLETQNAGKWFHYPLPGDDMRQGEYEAWHGGHLTEQTNEDPDRNLPLDAMRFLERKGVFGKLFSEYCVTCGNAGTIATMRKIGSEIAAYLKEKLVSAVVLTAT